MSNDENLNKVENFLTGRWYGRERCNYHKMIRVVQLDLTLDGDAICGKGFIEPVGNKLMPIDIMGHYEESTKEIILNYNLKNGQSQGCRGWYNGKVIIGTWGEQDPCYGNFKLSREEVWEDGEKKIFTDKETDELIKRVLGIYD